MSTCYHVTDVENLDSILRDGLVPQIGLLSEQLGETGEPTSAIYLFTSDGACRDAIGSWLGEAFDEMDEEQGGKSRHVVLRVELDDEDDDDDDDAFYEKTVYEPISPDRISIAKNLMCDFDYDEDWFASRYGDIIR